MSALKIALLVVVLMVVTTVWLSGATQFLELNYLQTHLDQIQATVNASPWLSGTIYVVIYILVAALSLPGAAPLTLLGGALFGLTIGTALTSFASTVGATAAFLISRWILGDSLRTKYADRFKSIDEGFRKDGPMYLFSLRLIPLFPFFLVNLLMGLTPIATSRYFFVSMIGMLPGTLVYVNAGTELAAIRSVKDLASPSLLLSFALLGLLPWLGKAIVAVIQRRKVYARFKKPKKFDYNLVVIGGGSAGLVTSYIASAVKAKVALIEAHRMGGDCLNTGCVPSKALIRSARFIHETKNAAAYGIAKTQIDFEFSQLMERVQSVIRKIEPHDSVERYTGLGVECIEGRAFIRSPFEVEVNGRVLTTENIVLATGARPFVPSIPGLKDIPYYTSDTLWNLREKPEHLLVLGGGPIGCELAQAFAMIGVKVTLIEKADQILAREDQDVIQLMQQRFVKDGLSLLTKSSVTAFRRQGNQNFATVQSQGKEQDISFSHVLIALGRKANTEGFGLEELGIQTLPNGTLEVDAYLRTKYPNILACGDLVGPYQFTHMAAHQAWFAAVNSLFGVFRKFKVDYRVVPWATYTSPEIARVGLSEQEAKAKGIDYQVSHYGIDDLDRAIADSADHGFVKVITAGKSDKVLGATIVAEHGSEMLPEFVTAMKYGLGLNKILGTIHVYPTMSEANKYAAGIWKKKNAPMNVLRWVERFHAWRRS